MSWPDVDAPATKIIVHQRENRKKCSVEPLRHKEGFQFFWFPHKERPAVAGYVRLGFGGPLLSRADAASGLLILDATWRHAERMEQVYADVPARSLPALRTGYPRVSKWHADPAHGLATIEALYVAHLLLGRPVTGLFDGYYWASDFLANNADLLAELSGGARDGS